MGIKGLQASQFGVFTHLDLKFATGINVFIGENATGKSQLLKLLYAVHTQYEQTSLDGLAAKLDGVFRPDSVGRLVHRGVGRGRSDVKVHFVDNATISFRLTTLGNIHSERSPARSDAPGRCIFLPTRDLLAVFEGFVALYEARELRGFDDTHYDTCRALALPALRGPRLQAARKLLSHLEDPLGGPVSEAGGRFYVRRREGDAKVDLEAPLLSEGLRKVATLVRLITNGSLTNKSVLFWDEPEANMNPRLVRDLVAFLQSIAQQGVQVFVATHDTLLCQRLSLPAEYALPRRVPTTFFGFHRDERDRVVFDVKDRFYELAQNPIYEEFAQFRAEEHAAAQQ